MKKVLALGAIMFCLAASPLPPPPPAYPFAIYQVINGHRHLVPNNHGPIASVHVHQEGQFLGAYTIVLVRFGDGAQAYFSMDTNELHLQAQ